MALLCLGFCMDSPSGPSVTDGMDVGIYFGLICLLHRGFWDEDRWYVPTGLGVVQGAVLMILGMPLCAGIFWGGVQTWIQRHIQQWGQIRLEWGVLPFLLMVASEYLDPPKDIVFPIWPLFSVCAIALAGYAGQACYARIRREALHKSMLGRALRRMQTAASAAQLDAGVKKQLCILLAQAGAIEPAALHTSEAGRALIVRIDAVSRDVEQCTGAPTVAQGGWSSELFRAETWNKLTGKKRPASLQEDLRQCNKAVMEMLHTGKPNTEKADSGLDAFEVFEQQARQLMYKAQQAPKPIAPRLESIALRTFEIVKSMREDPRDRPGGERFLQRYLPAATHIADEYTRLTASNNPREDVAQAIRRGEEVLARMDKAFTDELAAMLSNDSVSFTAELNALDKLLQMGGH